MNRNTSSSFITRAWTDKETETLYALREENIPYRLIALELKRSVSSCEKKYRATDWQSSKIYDKNIHRMKEDMKNGYSKHIANLNEKRLQLDFYKTDLIADKMVSAIKALPVKKNNVISKVNVISKNKTKNHSNEDVGLMFSDTHIGHQHSLEETGGISEYNQDVFYKRVETLKRGTEDIVELHSHLYKLPTLHIFCLGDIVAGMNNVGNWSPIYINMPIYDQMISGYDAISDMVYYWLDLFDNIKFYGVAGNHGRGAPKGFEKEYVNWDFLCYKFLESRFANNPRVEFIVPKTWWILAKIRNHKFLLVHGDDIKGGGTPLNGLQRYEQQMIGVLGEIPDYTLAAHFHNTAELTTNHGKILYNGCFTKDTEVQLSNGIMKNISDVKIGDKVIGKRLIPSKVTNIINKKYKGHLISVRVVGNSSPIKCTPNHEFLAVKSNQAFDIPLKNTKEESYNKLKPNNILNKIKPKFVAAENLGVGDYLAISCDKSKNNNSPYIKFQNKDILVTKNMARLIGFYLAEGSSAGLKGKNYHSTFTFHIKEEEYVNFVKNTLEKDFLIDKIGFLARPNKTTAEVIVNSIEFGNLIVSLCGKGAKNKIIRDDIMKWPINLQKEILKGYLLGDGHLAKVQRGQGSMKFMAATVSKTLRDQLLLISRNCGLNPNVRHQAVGGRRKSISYWIIFNGRDSEILSFDTDEVFKVEYPSFDRNYIICDNYKLVKISQCWSEDFDGLVYDLEVKGQESYNVQGIICHNSFIGPDVYSLKNLQRSSRAEQKIFGIHDKRGITWSYNIHLDAK